jgi:hypothetical protein
MIWWTTSSWRHKWAGWISLDNGPDLAREVPTAQHRIEDQDEVDMEDRDRWARPAARPNSSPRRTTPINVARRQDVVMHQIMAVTPMRALGRLPEV